MRLIPEASFQWSWGPYKLYNSLVEEKQIESSML